MQTLFGTRLHPMNVSEAARLTGYGRSTITRWKKDPSKMTVAALRILAEATEATDEELINLIRRGKWE